LLKQSFVTNGILVVQFSILAIFGGYLLWGLDPPKAWGGEGDNGQRLKYILSLPRRENKC